jgi:uncharacterized MAPEG superfamily protein
MTIPLLCLFIAMLMPLIASGVGNMQRKKQFGHMDNHNPRLQAAQLTGLGARAVAAQQNCWEALLLFTAAIAAAHFKAGSIDALPAMASVASILFIVARSSFIFCYLTDRATPRSASFGIGFASCIWLFWM